MKKIAFALLLATPAHADFEMSEHTVQLVGATADTLGVTIEHDEAWSMTVRPTPGADPITSKLTLPNEHAHYIAYVTPGRTSIALVALSTGRAPTAKDTIGWVYLPDGTLLRSWTYGAVVDAKDLAHSSISIAHHGVLRDFSVGSGVTFVTGRTGRSVVLAADATTFR